MIRIVCVGKLKEKYLLDACNEYIKRLNRYTKLEIIELNESILQPYELALEEEGKEINKHLKGYVIKLAINGNQLTSEDFATKIDHTLTYSNSDITFVIGSSHGLSPEVLSDYQLSFSKMTFPHQLSRVILLEQIYRAFSILNNSKYHK